MTDEEVLIRLLRALLNKQMSHGTGAKALGMLEQTVCLPLIELAEDDDVVAVRLPNVSILFNRTRLHDEALTLSHSHGMS